MAPMMIGSRKCLPFLMEQWFLSDGRKDEMQKKGK
jgi:hypothetical protein